MAFRFYPDDIEEEGEILLDKLLLIDEYHPVIEQRIRKLREAQSVETGEARRAARRRRAAPRRAK